MYLRIKSWFDRIAAGLLLIALSPLMAYLAWRIWREDPGPVIFKHTRIGKNVKPFGCLKFRSMRQDAPETLARWKENNTPEWQEFQAAHKLANDPRVLPIGRFIRKASLDELPQLFNVLRGEMSLVGPRPVTEAELVHYDQFGGLAAYLSIKPGVTGLWQVSGRSDTTYQERVALDRQYAETANFWLDITLLVKTLAVPFSQRGAY